ncbi:MAG TPA: tetratricopeptide repeat protein [Trichormus sp.]|jgi:tetratricopeptide (TPR) repeat protein
MATATRYLLAAALFVVALVTPLNATAGDFPDKGSRSQWSAALPYYNRGNRYLNEGRFDDAAADFQQAISLYEFDPDFYTNLGLAYRKLDNYAEAEQAFKKATDLSPDDWVPWMDLANAYLKQNKLNETIDAFNRTLKCNPPQADKEAILGDIADIKKILRMQGGDAPQERPNAAEDTRQNSAASVKAAPKRAAAHHAAAAAGRAQDAKSAHTPARAAAAATPAPAQVNPHTPAPTGDKTLKQSGWDYIYK